VDFESDDNKSDTPTVANPIIIVNMPNQWRTDTSRWTNIFENIAVKIITAPKNKIPQNIIKVEVVWILLINGSAFYNNCHSILTCPAAICYQFVKLVHRNLKCY